MDDDEARQLADRLTRARAAASAAGIDLVVLGEPAWIRYLTGYEPTTARPMLLGFDQSSSFVVAWDVPPVGLPDWIVVMEAGAAGADRALELAAGPSGRVVGCDRGVPWWLLPEHVRRRSASEAMLRVARRKDAGEIAVLRRNLQANEAAFRAVDNRLHEGSSGLDVFAWTSGALAGAHAGPVAWAGNVGVGAGAGRFDAQPDDSAGRAGDTVFVDLYPRVAGYVGDSSRSFVIERAASAWIVDAHARILRALERASRLLRPGASAAAIAAACLAELDPASLDAAFPHHVGHGVGLHGRERPAIVLDSADVVEEGDVICIEPGLYQRGRGGLRHEEVFHIFGGAATRLAPDPFIPLAAT